MDLPEYEEQLEQLGLSLETVYVLSAEQKVEGSVQIHERLARSFDEQSSSSSTSTNNSMMCLSVKYSFDGWATSQSLGLTKAGENKGASENESENNPRRRLSFSLDTSRMELGDDLEMVVVCDLIKDNCERGRIEDDNMGMKYRFICKNKTKFRPGKSLWWKMENYFVKLKKRKNEP